MNRVTNRSLAVCRNQFARRHPTEAAKALIAMGSTLLNSTLPSSRFFSGPSAEGNQHVVVALGGNALLKRKEEMTISNQRKNIREGMESLKGILQNNAVTMVHGNGPVSFSFNDDDVCNLTLTTRKSLILFLYL